MNDLGNILQGAKQLDPDGELTIGIITGPEETDKQDEAFSIQLAKNQQPAYRLKLG